MLDDKWVTFDCFGTLIDWQSGFHNILQSLAGERVDELIRAYHEAEASTQAAEHHSSYKDVLTSTLSQAAQAIDLPISAEQAMSLIAHWGSLPMFSDTLLALHDLHQDGWKVGILTNCDNDLFAQTLPSFNGEIDSVVTAEEVNGYKPGLGHFAEFERLTGVRRDRWVHAGVSWWHDMSPAKKLGIRSVWIDRENSGHDSAICTAHIHDMSSLPQTLRDLGVG